MIFFCEISFCQFYNQKNWETFGFLFFSSVNSPNFSFFWPSFLYQKIEKENPRIYQCAFFIGTYKRNTKTGK
jgi:hypothetical protein